MPRSSMAGSPTDSQTKTTIASSANPHNGTDIPPELQSTLQRIVDDVVENLGCVGAVAATLESDNALYLGAFSLKIAPDLLQRLEQRLDTSLFNPQAILYLDDAEAQHNIGIQAIINAASQNCSEKFAVSDKLSDLLRPLVTESFANQAQSLIEIEQVIAIPFCLEDEVVGSLFTATKAELSTRDLKFLTAFSRQAATAIQSQRRLAQIQALGSMIFDLQASLTDENKAFKVITDAVVNKLGYLAAFVAPCIGNSLPVRAYTVNSALVTQNFIDTWQRRLGFDMLGKKAVAYLDREDYAEQLSVRAIKSGQVQTSGSAYDLIRPVVPKRPLDMIQKLLGIKQVIAIPFFLENEAIGNLYVVSHRPKFSTQEQDILKAFGQQAAISIHNAQLYRKSEERRDAAQIFAKMAFSAAASVHALRNNVGAFRMYYQMIKPHLDDPTFQELGAGVMDSLNEAAHLLDSLHEPWRVKPDALTDINACMTRAVGKTVPNQGELKVKHGIVFHVSLAKNLPLIKTSPHMLTEAFMVLIRNALDAIREKTGAKDSGGDIWIETRKANDWGIEVVIRDNGAGIRVENLSKVFELGWSTKTAGMGFGMFWTKEYVEGLGGSITVDSVWQKGTTHLIKLPASIKE